jgi:protocatechuate 3,4-dioxygenase beta subunit
MNPDQNRRRLLAVLAGALVATPTLAGRRLLATPAQSAGPFYPMELPLDDDNDLTQVAGRTGVAAGRLTELSGRVLDLNGRAVTDARIEIWQCDANGRYRHPGDRGRAAPDENFQGHGQTRTDSSGRYRFRTIRPVPYPGRTPHIHIAVSAPQSAPLVTQLYINGEPRNAGDFLFNRVPADRRHQVQADFLPAGAGLPGVHLQAEFDMVLGGADGTPAG